MKALSRVVVIGLFHAIQMPDEKERALHNKIVSAAADMGLTATVNFVNAKFLKSSQGARVPVGNYDGIAGIRLDQYKDFPTWEDALEARLTALGEASEKVGGAVGNENKVPADKPKAEIDPDTGKPFTKAKLKKLAAEAKTAEVAKQAEEVEQAKEPEVEVVAEQTETVEKTAEEQFAEGLKQLEEGA